MWPIGPDYYYTFLPAVTAFWAGQWNLYDLGIGYYLAPWAIFLLLPLTIFGQYFLLLMTLVGPLVSIHGLRQNRVSAWIIFLALSNLHTFDLAIRGNVDGFLALGLGLGWMGIKKKNPVLLGAALWLLSIKPVNIVLPVIVLICAVWHWPRKKKLLVIAPIGTTIFLSFFLFGFDWPVQYITSIITSPPLVYLQTSLWRVVGQPAAYTIFLVGNIAVLALAAIRQWDRKSLLLALVVNLALSPYALGSHYILLAPAFVEVATERHWLAGLWLFTLTPLLRLTWGFGMAPLDVFYPIALLLCLSASFINHKNRQVARYLFRQTTG